MAKEKYADVSIDQLLTKISDRHTLEAIQIAYDIAQAEYRDRKTIIGMSQLAHGLRVADTLVDLDLDCRAIVVGLLNHLSEPHQIQIVSERLSPAISQLLLSLRKLDIYTEGTSRHSKRTLEAIRRASLSIINGDVRVVVVRLAMALQTLRGAAKLDDEDTRLLIARDVEQIYAPLANRLGIWTLKWELEDLSFRYQNPVLYKTLAKKLAERRIERNERIARAKELLRTQLDANGITATVSGRPKHIYSIHKKMERKRLDFEDLYDINALRIIIEQDDPEHPDLSEIERKRKTYAQCYKALGIVHSLWKPIPSEFDDYIQHPKPNGYRSVHTAVYDEGGKILEVQIRTQTMHNDAEGGFAAHWAYKEGGRPSVSLLRQIETLRNELNTINDDTAAAAAFNPYNETDASAEITAERVYVFTPNGDLIDLVNGATPIDFAYAIHSSVGHRTRGAKANGKMVPLTYQLRSGDRVEIITMGKKDDEYSIGRPSREWMQAHSGFTATNKARNRIRAWFRKYERDQNIEIGQATVERELKQLKLINIVTVEEIASQFNQSAEDFLLGVGFGDISMAQLEGAIALVMRDRRSELEESAEVAVEVEEERPLRQRPRNASRGMTVMGMTGLHTIMARCCNPIPPEQIVGYVTRGRGVTIHRADCKEVQAVHLHERERIVEADWGTGYDKNSRFQVPFRVKAYRSGDLLERIANTLQGQNVDLIKTKQTYIKDYLSLYLLTEVRDQNQANWIEQKLGKMEAVFEVIR